MGPSTAGPQGVPQGFLGVQVGFRYHPRHYWKLCSSKQRRRQSKSDYDTMPPSKKRRRQAPHTTTPIKKTTTTSVFKTGCTPCRAQQKRRRRAQRASEPKPALENHRAPATRFETTNYRSRSGFLRLDFSRRLPREARDAKTIPKVTPATAVRKAKQKPADDD